MKIKFIISAVLAAITTMPALAGGYLTNSNQSISFLRNPSQDAVIGVSSLYNNPAGVSFLNDGLHISFGIMNVHQNRDVISTFGGFKYGRYNQNQQGVADAEKKFHGVASAPILPSLQLAYNFKNSRWTASFDFGLVGGGGKCEYDKGLGSFESQVAMLPVLGQALGITGYDADLYMRGRSYQYGFQFGAGYKITKNLSVYGGLRLLYVTNNYFGHIKDISFTTDGSNYVGASAYFTQKSQEYATLAGSTAQQAQDAAEAAKQYAAAGDAANAAKYQQMAELAASGATQYKDAAVQMGTLGVATQDVELNCDQTAWGLTPVIGIDWKINEHWNLAAKYEFKTKIRLKNESANSASADNLSSLDQFKDGIKVAEDVPGIFTAGVQYSPISAVRINVGYHLYDDKHATKYGDKQELLSGNTWEITAGAEWDFAKNWTVSAGWQTTNYPNTDEYMKDISFATNSNTFGAGVKWQINKTVGVELAYFQTIYKEYEKSSADYNNASNLVRLAAGDATAEALIQSGQLKGSDKFTRSNWVLGGGVTLDF